MYPILGKLALGNQLLIIKSYRFFLVLAVLFVIAIGFYMLVKRGIPRAKALLFLLTMVLAVPIGARLLHILSNPRYYAGDPGKMFNLHLVGFALYGGLILAVLAAWGFCRVMKLDLWRVADAIVPGLGIGLAITRVGCYLNGCCFGKITGMPWGVVFPPGSPANPNNLSGTGLVNHLFQVFSNAAVHPTQLYELLAALLGTALALWVMKRQKKDGLAFLAFVLWFTSFRWFNWHFRVPSATLALPYAFYPVLYAGIIMIAAILFYRRLIQDNDSFDS